MNPEGNPRDGGADSAVEAGRSVFDWVHRGDRLDYFLHTFEPRLRRHRRRRRRMAIGIVAGFVLVGLAWRLTTGSATERTGGSAIVAQPVRKLLPDGSVVELKAGADVATAFTATARRVVLRRGTAHFQVVKSSKAFVVVAGGIEVRAVGTGFSVQLDHRAVEVLVTEGRVSVNRGMEPPQASEPPASADSPAGNGRAETLALVDAGTGVKLDLASFAARPQIAAVPEAQFAERLSWRVPRLEFNGTPLAEAMDIINRHSPVRLRLGDVAAGKVELSGVLRADNIEPLLKMLENHYGLATVRSGDTVEIFTVRKP